MVRGGAAGAGAGAGTGARAAAAPAERPPRGEQQGGRGGDGASRRGAAGGRRAGGRAWGAVEEQVQGGALPRVERAALAVLGQLQLFVEGQEAWMQVAGARQPVGVVAVLALLWGLGGGGLRRGADGLPPLAVEGLQRGAKVLVELRSDLIVAQELPADGGKLLLLLSVGGLGGPKRLRGGCSSARRGWILLLG